jgi:hypothetical protein
MVKSMCMGAVRITGTNQKIISKVFSAVNPEE